MQVNFPVPTDNKLHRICLNCHSEDVDQVQEHGNTVYRCNNCQQIKDRSIYFDKLVFWIDEDNVLWHESVGVIVRNPEGKCLFYERSEFPIALTLPSGHLDIGEDAQSAGARELEEEVGLKANSLINLGIENIDGDSCSSGSDNHKVHTFLYDIDHDVDITVREEGRKPVWLSPQEALTKNLSFVARATIETYIDEL